MFEPLSLNKTELKEYSKSAYARGHTTRTHSYDSVHRKSSRAQLRLYMRKINKREQRGALACTARPVNHTRDPTRLGVTGSGQDEVGLPFRPSGGLLTFPAEEDLVRSLDELDEPEAIECGAHTVEADEGGGAPQRQRWFRRGENVVRAVTFLTSGEPGHALHIDASPGDRRRGATRGPTRERDATRSSRALGTAPINRKSALLEGCVLP